MNDIKGAKYAMQLAASEWKKPKPRAPKHPHFSMSTTLLSPHPIQQQQHATIPPPPAYYPGPATAMLSRYPPAVGPSESMSPHLPLYHPMPPSRPQTPVASVRRRSAQQQPSPRKITPGTPRSTRATIVEAARTSVASSPIALFGEQIPIPRRATKTILSYLSKVDMGNSLRVSKQWNSEIAALLKEK